MKRPFPAVAAVSLLLAACLAAPTAAWSRQPAGGESSVDPIRFDEAQALRASQAAIGRPIGDLAFVDSRGRTVRLSEFRGRPVLLNFIYTGCAQSCGVVTRVLADIYTNARDVLGRDSFVALTIGFDVANDTPARMRTYARERDVASIQGWRFLSGDEAAVKTLADTVGFAFFPSAKGFDHIDQVTLIDAEGKINTQIYGEAFDKPVLIEPLKSLIYGTPAPYRSIDDLVKKIRLFCTLYDPKADRYRFNYALFIELGTGILVIGTVLIFVVREIVTSRRRRREQRVH
jgi:protein SCO1/2